MRIVVTSDGSHTLYNQELDEHYHSVHGAIRESQHVFIEAGLNALPEPGHIHLLEVGLGTGLNAVLTALSDKNVTYTALEAYPLEKTLLDELNYPALLGTEQAGDLFNKLHAAPWKERAIITPSFQLQKLKTTVQETNFDKEFNLVYFDAFAPTVQPELWTKEIFDKMFNALKPGGILVTYCAKGEVKRNMKAAGFKVEALQGPPGKREMTRAWKC